MKFKIHEILREEASDGGDAGGDGGGSTTDSGGGATSGADGGSGDAGADGGKGSEGEVVNTWTDNTGQLNENWMDNLGEEFEPMKTTLGRFRSVEEMSKSLYHTKQLLGKKGDAVVIPGEDATDIEVSEFRKAMGLPEDITDYGISALDDMPEGMEVQKEEMSQFIEYCFESGIKPEFADGLMKMHLANQATAMQQFETEQQAYQDQQQGILQQEWGAAYDQNWKAAELGAKSLGINLENYSTSDMMKGMLTHGKAVGEDHMRRGETEFMGDQANKLKAKDIMTNPSNPLYSKYQDKDEATVTRVRALMQS